MALDARRAGRVALGALLLAGAAAPARAATTPGVTPAIIGAAGANGWYRSPVTVRWDVGTQGLLSTSGCEAAVRIVDDTTGVTQRCQASYDTGVTLTGEAKVKIDKTPPLAVHAVPQTPANAAGWFAKPVTIAWAGTDPVSGIASCTSTTYSGPDASAVPLSGTCQDAAGNVSAPAAFSLNYDATAPVVTGAGPARPPDHAGWYLRPIGFAFQGQDALSGIDACDTVTYAGPDHSQASVAGACRDRAGNSTTGTVPVHYDGAPPTLTGVRAIAGRRVIRLRWRASDDARRVVVTRSPGRGSHRSVVLYRGTRHAFVDRHVRRDVRYTYAITAVDRHTKTATTRVAVTSSLLLAPRRGAHVASPIDLRWRAFSGASYYNVQLFRGKRVVASFWPSKPSLTLRRQLPAGRYRWYVWPGYGVATDRHYGRLLGHSTFTVG